MKPRKTNPASTAPQKPTWDPLAGLTPEQHAQAQAEHDAEQEKKWGHLQVPTPFPAD